MRVFFFLFKKAGAHFQYVCNNCAKFQTDCLKTVEEVAHKIVILYKPYSENFFKFVKAVILSKNEFFPF